jgi:hypothetical protein
MGKVAGVDSADMPFEQHFNHAPRPDLVFLTIATILSRQRMYFDYTASRVHSRYLQASTHATNLVSLGPTARKRSNLFAIDVPGASLGQVLTPSCSTVYGRCSRYQSFEHPLLPCLHLWHEQQIRFDELLLHQPSSLPCLSHRTWRTWICRRILPI